MDLDIQHGEDAGRYYALIDGREAVCEYGRAGEKTLNFWHTYVPPELRGRASSMSWSAKPCIPPPMLRACGPAGRRTRRPTSPKPRCRG